ncbi:Protein NRT1/ PTR FAMILY 4.6 [Glycine soja]|uniref:Protein NRT1/ PTR FAMILY 4.6 n=1 Tax=Glycine soja TaxID=3848 RepID=A0A445KPS1_GLYSO|nr:Protein NRT1/ PTR FAMILY 4.6 [Glycine soja]
MATLSLAENFVSYFTGIIHYELADAANIATDYMGGLALLTVQAHMGSLTPPICNVAGLKASLPSHGAPQFDERDPKEAIQMSSFFNGLLLAVCIGGAVTLTSNVYIQDCYGWDWGFGISTGALV